MHSGLIDRLIPPKLRANNEDLMRCRILVGLIFYIFIVVSAMAVVRLITSGLTDATLMALMAVPVLVSLLLVFHLTASRKLTGDILVLVAITIVTLIAWGDGGLYARTIFWFPCIPLIANFLAGKIRSLWTTFICWTVLLVMFYAHNSGSLPVYDFVDLPVGRLSAAMASVMFVAIISYLYEDSHQRAEDERRKLDQSKSNWVSMVSHELRTPLTAIYGSLGLTLKNKNREVEEIRNMLAIAYSNCQRLVRLVDDVLDIEKIESGELKLNRGEADLVKLVHEVELTNRDIARKAGVRIEVSSIVDELVVSVDADRVTQALQNLVSNAVKFSPESAAVKIRIEQSGNEVLVSISDQGVGISPEFQQRIFSRFAQAEDAGTRKQGGSGLGLNITKSIIEQHGGVIGFRNNASMGATFYFTLPLDVK